MVSFERIEPLPHIIIQREPQQAEIRPRRYPGNRIQPRSNRRQHAERMKEQTTVSAAELARIRASLGVAADRFLVLRLETLDVNQREALERLDISVVEELEEKRDGRTIHRLLIQFADEESLATFTAEYDRYAEETDTHTALPHGKRRDLFDALESVSLVTSEERTGRRLRREGRPARELFYLDVDLWNPGTDDGYQGVLTSFREVVQSCGGSIVKDPLMIPSLILVKVEATLRLLEALLQLDTTSTVQKRAWNSNQGTVFLKRPDPNGDPSLHIFVGCRTRFPNPLGEDSQRYALVITIEHDRQHVDVYQEVRARVKTRARIRVTG